MEKKEKEASATSRATAGGWLGSHEAGVPFEYFREARLFLGKDRATLTFYVDQEVASIHYDAQRDEIFYRGHNVKNMTMSPEQWQSLRKFGEYLEQDPRAASLLVSYKRCLEHVM